MTIIGKGGVVIASITLTEAFKKRYKKMPEDIQSLFPGKIDDLQKSPMPAGLRFEKLKGYTKPNIYTIHLTGNYKLSFKIEGDNAILRNIGTHNEIDRNP